MVDSLILNNLVDKVYVINLDRRQDRLIDITNELNKHNIKFERISAVDGELIEGKHHLKHFDLPGDRNKAAVGCLRSHKNIILDAVKNNYKSICIFEDDVILQENFNEKLKNILHFIPADWDMLFLGCHWWKLPEPINIGNNIYKLNGCFGAFGYIIKSNVFQDILLAIEQEDIPYDDALCYKVIRKHNAFTTVPFLVKVKMDYSDIAKCNTNYTIISDKFY